MWRFEPPDSSTENKSEVPKMSKNGHNGRMTNGHRQDEYSEHHTGVNYF